MREKYFPQFYKDWIQLVKKNKNTILKKKNYRMHYKK